jgi:hypothetical protein
MKRVVLAVAMLNALGLAAATLETERGLVLATQTKTTTTEHDRQGNGLISVWLGRTTVKTDTYTLIRGVDYTYLIVDHHKHPCRFVEQDEVVYGRDKSKLHVIDVDRRECTLEIIRQERTPQKP